MPLAFSAVVGGNCTLIGTSTNVAVSGYMSKVGLAPLGMFEIAHIGIIMTIIFMAYMMTLGKRLLPDHQDIALQESYGMRDYLSEIIILPQSQLIGQRVFTSNLSQMNFRILVLIRDQHRLEPTATTLLEEGDLLLVEGKMENLLQVKETAGIQIKADTLGFYDKEDLQLGEILIPARSPLVNSSIRDINFRQRLGLVVLAVHRSGQTLREKISNVVLSVGDLLLVQGPGERFDYLKRSNEVMVLGEYKPVQNARKKGLLTLVFFMLSVLIATLGLLPLSVAFVAAAIGTVLIRAIPIEKAYQQIDWRLLILIAGMSAFGTAMAKTGADVFISKHIINLFEPLGVIGIMGGFILLTVMLTQPMSNAAAALVVLPIALQSAQALHVNPRTFAIAVMLAASVSLITPFEPSCILVYGPGKYRFWDFMKVGSGITLVLMLVILLLVPYFWPL